MKMDFYKKTSRYIIVLLACLSFLLVGSLSVFAANDTQVAEVPKSEGKFTPTTFQNGDYVEATNTFEDGNVKYYLLTQDNAKADLKKVTYKGKDYPLEAVKVVDSENFNFAGLAFKAKDGSIKTPLKGGSADKDFTLFIDDGVYNDTNSTNYTSLSHTNGSYVGLNTKNGEPTATITRDARTDTNTWPSIKGDIERSIIMHGNVYIENLIFDGKDRDLLTVRYRQAGKNKKYRGEYFFNVTGVHKKITDGLVMRDIIIQNVGTVDEKGFAKKNCAINVHYNPGQVNLENIKVRKVRTRGRFGVVQIQDGDSINVRNIDIDMSEANKAATPIKVETTWGFEALAMTGQKFVIDNLKTSNIKDPLYDNIYVQDYRYEYVKIPKDYRYAFWNTSNGSIYSSSVNIYKELLPSSKYKAIQDMKDNYWIVDTDSSEATIEEQLEAIARVMAYTQRSVPNQKSPEANIKFIGDKLPSFNINTSDGWWKNQDSTDKPINIVAVTSVDDKVLSTTVKIPTVKDFKANFKNAGKVNLYNFDFESLSKYTNHEVGLPVEEFVAKDGYDGNYPAGMNAQDYRSAKAEAITKNDLPSAKAAVGVSYFNSRFVGLATKLNASMTGQAISLDADPDVPVPSYKLILGDTATFNTDIKDTEAYLNPDIADLAARAVDDKEVHYISSDTNVATISQAGVITPISVGEVIIYAKAKDTLNNGEIEKPFASARLSIIDKPKYKAIHKFVSQTTGKELPTQVMDLVPPNIVGLEDAAVVSPNVPASELVEVDGGKWKFVGYDKASATVNGADLIFKGSWEFIENPAPAKKYNVTYKFTSDLEDKNLPAEVMSLLPVTQTGFSLGDKVYPTPPSLSVVAVAGGKWHFTGFDKAFGVVEGKDIAFNGTWNFVSNKTPDKPQKPDGKDIPSTGVTGEDLIIYLSLLGFSMVSVLVLKTKNKNK